MLLRYLKKIFYNSVAELRTTFTDSIRSIKWLKEYKMGTRRDAIDIYGKDCISGCNVIIELDKPRADQVAKKCFPE